MVRETSHVALLLLFQRNQEPMITFLCQSSIIIHPLLSLPSSADWKQFSFVSLWVLVLHPQTSHRCVENVPIQSSLTDVEAEAGLTWHCYQSRLQTLKELVLHIILL